MTFVAEGFRKCVRELNVGKASGSAKAVRFNRDGNYCMTCGSDKYLNLWNPHTGNLLKSYAGHGFEVLDADASHDNARLASGSADKSVVYWDVATGRVLRKYRGHIGNVNCVKFSSPDSTVIISGSYDTTVCCWDTRSRRKDAIQSLKEAKDSVPSLQVTPNEIIAGSVDGHTRVYDLRNGKMTEDCIGEPVTSVCQTRDGQCILVSSLDNTLRLIDKDNGEMLNSYKGHKNEDYKIDNGLSFDDVVVVSGSEDGGLYFWDLVNGKVSHHVKNAHSGVLYSVAMHPSKSCLLTAGMDTVKYWSAETDEEIVDSS